MARKIRNRSPSFGEYYAQPRLFWLSQTPIEQQHIIGGFSFELSKVVRVWIRERVVDHLAHIDIGLAEAVANNLGIELSDEQRNIAPPAPVNGVEKDPTLSLYADGDGDVKGRIVAVLLNEKTCAQDVLNLLQALQARGVHSKLLYSRMGEVSADDGSQLPIAGTFAGSPSLTVDAVIVPGGDLTSISDNGDARYYLLEAYKHLKPILLAGDARQFSSLLQVPATGEEGVIECDAINTLSIDKLLTLLAAHRVWSEAVKLRPYPHNKKARQFMAAGLSSLYVAIVSEPIATFRNSVFQFAGRQHVQFGQPRIAVSAAHNGVINKCRMTHHFQRVFPAVQSTHPASAGTALVKPLHRKNSLLKPSLLRAASLVEAIQRRHLTIDTQSDALFRAQRRRQWDRSARSYAHGGGCRYALVRNQTVR